MPPFSLRRYVVKRSVYMSEQRSLRMLFIMLAIIIFVVIVLIQTDRCIRPTINAICEEECQAFTSRLIGKSIHETLSENPYDYNDFSKLLHDENGNITAVETLTGNVNRLQAELLVSLNEALDNSRDMEIEVSLGTASGVWIFAGKGPSLPMRILPIGSADVELVSTFESSGINQTCHKITIEVNAHVAGAVPFFKTETNVKYEYILTETVIVGNVPNGYAVLGK